ncbi:hypothetical protein ACFX2I_024202 [Malus domestica]
MYSDVWDPIKTPSLSGRHWFVTFVDDYSRRSWVYTMKHKSELGLSKSFWAEAITYTCHIINCSGVKSYRLWCPKIKKLVISRDMTFDEESMFKDSEKNVKDVQQVELKKVASSTSNPISVDVEATTSEEVGDHEDVEEVEIEDSFQNEEQVSPQEFIAKNRGKRHITKPAWYNDYVAFALPIITDEIPSNFEEAIESEEKEKWCNVMDDEMNSLLKNKTWKLAKLPKGKKTIGCKWVYAKKAYVDEKRNVRFKARLVAKGYAQRKGIDYNAIFSSVVKHSSICIMLALVAQYDLELMQLDVNTIFLHGDLNEEIYMCQPDGYKVKMKENLFCKLKKSLCGLKQPPRQWYLRFDRFMSGQNYSRSQYNHCVYLKKLQDEFFVYLLIYVDDMLIASKNVEEIERLKKQMKNEFEMKYLGEAKKIIGIKINRDVCLIKDNNLRS